MAKFVLVHGTSHGAWCWSRVAPLLRRNHEVVAIELPSHGEDQTQPGSVSLSDYADAVVAAMSSDTILVGHSLGGLSITLAAAAEPHRTRALVYLCALIPRPGEAFSDFRRSAISPAVSKAQIVDRDLGVSRVIPDMASDLFYFDCSDEDRQFAVPRLSPQPIAPMTQKLEFDQPDCPKHYIRCLLDRVVYPSYQTDVSSGWEHTYDLASGHSPFFSHVGELTAILELIAKD